MLEPEIENATLEAIYWWNRDEFYYHKYFSQLDKIYKDKLLLDFFTKKIFQVFLREYSVRRNLSPGLNSVFFLLDELFENNFFEHVVKANTDIIDELSSKLKVNCKSTSRHTKSLLSKIAFLINPNDFSLYDNLSKDALKLINKNTHFRNSALESYSGFLKQTNFLRITIYDNGLFLQSINILNEFKETEAFKFFTTNNQAFEMRIVDKFLWLLTQSSNNNIFQNNEYRKLIKL